MPFRVIMFFVLSVLVSPFDVMAGRPNVAFPKESWSYRKPQQASLDPIALDEIAKLLGGRGCVVKDGYVVKTWGPQATRSDWYSSAKPVLSTLLFFALKEGLVKSVDQPIADFGWPLTEKDRAITFRHLGAMTSGYRRSEGPGEAFAYNDFAIQLYQQTLFDKVFRDDPRKVVEHPDRLGAMQLEDGLAFREKNRRLSASVRDFARIAWFWLNEGRWNEKALLPRDYFETYVKPQTPKSLPHTGQNEEEDYLGIGSYGGGSNHFTQCGPGVYGFNWWFNDTGGNHPDDHTWPDAPRDTYMSIGARGNCSAIFPSLSMVLVCADGDWGELKAGDRDTQMNRVLALAAGAVGGRVGSAASVSGELKKWHRLTISFAGPETGEKAESNPFLDYRLKVTFRHGSRKIDVPGYYAADGNAAETGADSGGTWRVHFTPDAEGVWTFETAFRKGPGIAVTEDPNAGEATAFDGAIGEFDVGPTDKLAPDHRARGLLGYRGKRYLQFAETGAPFLKGGADSPENFLAFGDFDQTPAKHSYTPHAGDWHPGDPVWRGDRGKNIIGALNYLAGAGMNSVYFLTMNVKGDGKDVWPWTSEKERYRFDCSKLDQWEIVFSHMDKLGIVLHVITQEQENDQLLDKGDLGVQRKLYYRELIARFGHHLGLVWNLGEENTNTPAQRRAFAESIRGLDPYDHPIVIHTFPSKRDEVYGDLIGYPTIEGPSLQLGNVEETHGETLKWVRRSQEAGHPWVVCLDEIGPPKVGVLPDANDPRHDGVRRQGLWGNLMAGGAGCEWFFGTGFPHGDLDCEDWRSRASMWALTRYAVEFFHEHLPFTEMVPADELVEPGGAWCLAKPGEVYGVYGLVGDGWRMRIPAGRYRTGWYDPRHGGALVEGEALSGPGTVNVGAPPRDAGQDWVALIRRVD